MDDIDDLLDDFENVIRTERSHQKHKKRSPSPATSYTLKQKPVSFGSSNCSANAVTNISGNLSSQARGSSTSNSRGKAAAEDDDLSDLLNLDVSSPMMPTVPPLSSASSSSSSASRIKKKIGKRKCSPPMLDASSMSTKACQSLWCVGCDFKVSGFDNQKWDSSVDYLFFRNSYPETHKLATKMLKQQGSRAYACQCTWKSITALTSCHGLQNCRWVCTGCTPPSL